MPDRIFTTQQQDQGLGPTEVINTVDYNKVAEMLQQVRGETVPAASEPMIGYAALVEAKKPEVEAATVCEKCGSAKCSCVQGKVQARKIPRGGKCPECSKAHPCACDMGKAAMAGDDVAIGIMTELRNQRRYALLSQHEEAVRIAEAQRAHERQVLAERQAITDGLEALEQAAGTMPEDATPVASSEPKFQSVNELTASQKDRFSKWAQKMGWPAKYVEAFVTPKVVEAEVDPFLDSIMVIASQSDLDAKVRQGLIEAMCKEAKLKPEQAARVQKYWSSEVGLPTDWVSKLVKEPDIK